MTPGGRVHLVGAGPGDPGLLTLRALHLLSHADVVVYDRLVDPAMLCDARPGAELIDVGKGRGLPRDQDAIEALLVERARRGQLVVRLKGGDPFVFGRGAEELAACRAAGVPCEVVPGITSAVAAPARIGVAVTHRGIARGFAVLTAETLHGPSRLRVRPSQIETLAILMGRQELQRVTEQLIEAGWPPQTPAVCVQRATQPNERWVGGTLETIAERADRSGLRAPVVTVIGEVAALARDPVPEPPLGRRRVVVTRPLRDARRLRRRLLAAGAQPLVCPLIRIVHPQATPQLDAALREIRGFGWIVLTSTHAVDALLRRLRACCLDARALAGCRIAAVGSATARRLGQRGLRADLTPQRFTAAALLEVLRPALAADSRRVLYPRSDLAGPLLADGLRRAGAELVDVPAYHTVTADPSPGLRAALAGGVDAVVFHSPSAVRSYAASGLHAPGAAIACIGPSTAGAAREAGLAVDVVAEPHNDEGLLLSLQLYFKMAATGGGLDATSRTTACS